MAQSKLDAGVLAGFLDSPAPGDLVAEKKVDPGMAF